RNIAPHERRNSTADIVRLTPPECRYQAVGDEGVVALAPGSGHIRGNDAGPHFVDGDATGRESSGKQACGHRQSGFAHAVLAAVHRDELRRYGCNEDY